MKKFIIILFSLFFISKANAEVEKNIYEKIDLFMKFWKKLMKNL